MSSGSQRRNRITVALGAMSAVAFSGMYGLIASNAPATTTAATPEVLTISSASQTTAVATPTPAPQVAAVVTTDSEDGETALAATAGPTAAPNAAATTAVTTITTHAQTRGS